MSLVVLDEQSSTAKYFLLINSSFLSFYSFFICSGYLHDDGYMICCDGCTVWQHIICVGVAPSAIPETYYCEKCKPRKIDVKAAKRVQMKFVADAGLNGSVLNNLSVLAASDSGLGSQSSSPGASSLNEAKVVAAGDVVATPGGGHRGRSFTQSESANNKDGGGVKSAKRRRSSLSQERSSLGGLRAKSTEKVRRDSGRSISKKAKVKISKPFRRVSFSSIYK